MNRDESSEWVRYFDSTSQHFYFLNEVTNESLWEGDPLSPPFHRDGTTFIGSDANRDEMGPGNNMKKSSSNTHKEVVRSSSSSSSNGKKSVSLGDAFWSAQEEASLDRNKSKSISISRSTRRQERSSQAESHSSRDNKDKEDNKKGKSSSHKEKVKEKRLPRLKKLN